MLSMYKQITIQTLHKQGVKQADIAKQLGCHRNTVRNVLQREAYPVVPGASYDGSCGRFEGS